jgi:hypothetical protein
VQAASQEQSSQQQNSLPTLAGIVDRETEKTRKMGLRRRATRDEGRGENFEEEKLRKT